MNIPLHPMVVHFPIVLSVLLPVFAVALLWAIQRGRIRARAWGLPVLIALTLLVSAFVATRTGESEEDRVEDVVGENALHAHEDAAERFLVLAAVTLLIAAAGLVPGATGTAARYATTAASVLLLFAGYQTGTAGGELVYRHNAASAYVIDQPEARVQFTNFNQKKETEHEDD